MKSNKFSLQENSKIPEFVGAIIQDKQGRILVSQRSLRSKMYPGQWQIPGGKVEKDENSLKALKREVKEETNLEVISAEPLIALRYNSNVLIYLVQTQGKPKTMEPEKLNTGWIYIEVNELKKMAIIPALAELLKKQDKNFNLNKKQELEEIFAAWGVNIKTLHDLKEKN
ncbi:2958_t:CDS:2, partial [Funneliformis geosporum]